MAVNGINFAELEDQLSIIDSNQIKRFVSTQLLSMNMCASSKGFEYIRDAVTLIVVDRENDYSLISKTLYPKLAKSYGTKSGAVERAIRNAITTAEWSTVNYKCIFGNDKFHYTNKEFICCFAEYVRNNFCI